MAWQFDLASDIGGRAEQQDRVDVLEVSGRPGDHLVVLADGMGGQQHGAIAAQAVIDTARSVFNGLPISDPKQFLMDLCRTAHAVILEIGQQRRSDPASTCVVLYTRDTEAYWAHVGDSRLYHFSGNRLLSHTRDHTMAELLKDAEGTGLEEGFSDPEDNRLYMSLGGKNELDPEFNATCVGENDWFMLCSDGFWDQVEAGEVAYAQTDSAPDRKSAADLAALASQRAGSRGDNVSLVLARHEHSQPVSRWRRFLPTGLRIRK